MADKTTQPLPPDLPISLPLRTVEAIAAVLGEIPAKNTWRLLAQINAAVGAAADKIDPPSEPKKEAA